LQFGFFMLIEKFFLSDKMTRTLHPFFADFHQRGFDFNRCLF